MIALKRLAAAYVILMAVAVAVHFVITPLYDPELDGAARTVWDVLNPLMVVAVIVALIAAFDRKRRLDAGAAGQSGQREHLEANFGFYAVAALFLVLLWNWFSEEWGNGGDGTVWVYVDVAFPLLPVR